MLSGGEFRIEHFCKRSGKPRVFFLAGEILKTDDGDGTPRPHRSNGFTRLPAKIAEPKRDRSKPRTKERQQGRAPSTPACRTTNSESFQ